MQRTPSSIQMTKQSCMLRLESEQTIVSDAKIKVFKKAGMCHY